MLLSSVSSANADVVWQEVDASCVYSLDLSKGEVSMLAHYKTGTTRLSMLNRVHKLFGTRVYIAKQQWTIQTAKFTLSTRYLHKYPEAKICSTRQQTDYQYPMHSSRMLCKHFRVS